MRILFLTRYTRQGASSRIRAWQYLPFLAQNGIQADVAPLFPSAYLAQLYQHQRRPWALVATSYWRRIWRLLVSRRRYDLLWIQYELFPNMPTAIEKWLLNNGPPVVIDYDDAMLLNYQSGHPLKQRWLGDKIADLMKSARLIIGGNDFLCDYARQAGASWVEYLPSVVDKAHYPQFPKPANPVFTIGWIGSPSTSQYLSLIQPALAEICKNGQARVVLVGAPADLHLPNVPITHLPWSEETEAQHISQFDVGIMPLADSDWERGKCGYKLIQYMAESLPVIASNVGANPRIVTHGITGFLASTTTEWVAALQQLRAFPEARLQMGTAGYEKYLQEFELGVTGPKLVSLLQQAVQQAPP
jgi:glycosyltransferase involved in cell wall biosynthesis